MERRIDLMTNEIGAKIAKRIYNVSLAIEQSPLPKATQELLGLRASQINVIMHSQGGSYEPGMFTSMSG
jgi:hypothetical protein